MADMQFELQGPGAAGEVLTEDVKKKLKKSIQETIKKELAKEENGGITAAGHAKSSISW